MGWYKGKPWDYVLQLWKQGFIIVSDDIIWPPKVKDKQRFVVTGTRGANEPALIPCHGLCGSKWTWHHHAGGPSFACSACKTIRRWGLDF